VQLLHQHDTQEDKMPFQCNNTSQDLYSSKSQFSVEFINVYNITNLIFRISVNKLYFNYKIFFTTLVMRCLEMSTSDDKILIFFALPVGK